MTRTPEQDRLVGYMPIVVRMGGISQGERKFAASIIAQDKRRALVPSSAQMRRMEQLVNRLLESAET